MISKLKIIPLGGLGEIGKNMTAIEYGSDIIVIDCGMGFPDEDMYGVDIVLPDFSYLKNNASRIRGLILTHGHEDHIGGVPYFLREVDVPIYTLPLTAALVELKLERFTHENIGQLNTYVSWWRQNMMAAGDNPPIGILLCTEKNNALAEYALAGMDNNLFVSKYMLGLPRKEDMQAFLERQVRSLEGA